ncbi:MAG TPA: hypothetical protein VGG78_00825 [Gemmatimonadaceae bacterium]
MTTRRLPPVGRREVHLRPGAALLEALVALTILAWVALAAAHLVADAGHAAFRTRTTARELARANAFMNAVALWPRDDLDRHLGSRDEGSWMLQIDRVTPDLYDVTLVERFEPEASPPSLMTGRVLLTTSLYRHADDVR